MAFGGDQEMIAALRTRSGSRLPTAVLAVAGRAARSAPSTDDSARLRDNEQRTAANRPLRGGPAATTWS